MSDNIQIHQTEVEGTPVQWWVDNTGQFVTRTTTKPEFSSTNDSLSYGLNYLGRMIRDDRETKAKVAHRTKHADIVNDDNLYALTGNVPVHVKVRAKSANAHGAWNITEIESGKKRAGVYIYALEEDHLRILRDADADLNRLHRKLTTLLEKAVPVEPRLGSRIERIEGTDSFRIQPGWWSGEKKDYGREKPKRVTRQSSCDTVWTRDGRVPNPSWEFTPIGRAWTVVLDVCIGVWHVQDGAGDFTRIRDARDWVEKRNHPSYGNLVYEDRSGGESGELFITIGLGNRSFREYFYAHTVEAEKCGKLQEQIDAILAEIAELKSVTIVTPPEVPS
jgi:hypothetical protein